MNISEIANALEQGKTVARTTDGLERRWLYKLLTIEGQKFCYKKMEKSPTYELKTSIFLELNDKYEIYEEQK